MLAQPQIKVIGQNEFSFGKIYAGAYPIHKLKIQNSGTEQLTINTITSSCACYRVEISKNIIAPNKTAVITVTLISDKLTGEIYRSITVSSNDPIQPVLFIKFSATILSVFEIHPDILLFKNSECVNGISKKISFTNKLEKKLTILSITDSSYRTRFRFQKKKLTKGETEIIEVFANPAGVKSMYGEFKILTDSKRQPEIFVRYIIEGSKISQ